MHRGPFSRQDPLNAPGLVQGRYFRYRRSNNGHPENTFERPAHLPSVEGTARQDRFLQAKPSFAVLPVVLLAMR